MKVELSKEELSILLSSMSTESAYTLKEKSEKLDWIDQEHKGKNSKGHFELYEKLKRLYYPEFY